MSKTEVVARLYEMGLGITHVSIVVFGWEYSYNKYGFSRSEPHQEECEEVKLGKTAKTEQEFDEHFSKMRTSWTSRDYKELTHNCQDFAEMLIKFLGVSNLPIGVNLVPHLGILGFGVVLLFAVLSRSAEP